MAHLLELFPKGKTASGWKMSKGYLDKYSNDPQIKSFVLRTETTSWWSGKQGTPAEG